MTRLWNCQLGECEENVDMSLLQRLTCSSRPVGRQVPVRGSGCWWLDPQAVSVQDCSFDYLMLTQENRLEVLQGWWGKCVGGKRQNRQGRLMTSGGQMEDCRCGGYTGRSDRSHNRGREIYSSLLKNHITRITLQTTRRHKKYRYNFNNVFILLFLD